MSIQARLEIAFKDVAYEVWKVWMNKDFLSLFYRKLNPSFTFSYSWAIISIFQYIAIDSLKISYCNTFFLYRYIDNTDHTQNLASKLSFLNHIKRKKWLISNTKQRYFSTNYKFVFLK